MWNSTYADKTGNAAVLSLYGDEQDRKGATDWRFEYKFGHISNDAFDSTDETTRWLAGDSRTAGTYNKIRANILRRQDLNDRTYLLLSARGQYAFDNLDSSEHFSLGGPYGVRAYPTSEASFKFGLLFRPHPVPYGNRQIADKRSFSFMLVQDRDTQCQTDEAMTVYVRLACMAGMVMQQRNSIELLAEFRYRRIIDTEEDRFIL